jgi:predicted nucleic acid-binding protein
VKIYLDTNVYFRPYDDHSQERIREEAFAFISIIDIGRKEGCILLNSDILSLEVKKTDDLLKRREVEQYLEVCGEYIELNEKIKGLAKELEAKCFLDGRDALHISFGCYGDASYLLTCDNELINRKDRIEKVSGELGYLIKIVNPIDFLKILREKEEAK